MRQIQYNNVEFQVQDGPDGTKVLAIAEPPVAIHIFLIDAALAESIGDALKGQSKPQIALPKKPQLVVPGA